MRLDDYLEEKPNISTLRIPVFNADPALLVQRVAYPSKNKERIYALGPEVPETYPGRFGFNEAYPYKTQTKVTCTPHTYFNPFEPEKYDLVEGPIRSAVQRFHGLRNVHNRSYHLVTRSGVVDLNYTENEPYHKPAD